jgi:xanthine dehydrogenase accessory factor
MASAAARLLHLSGCTVLVLEREQPLAVRRLVSFAEAVGSGHVDVESVRAERCALQPPPGRVGVTVDPAGALLPAYAPDLLLDARMLKRGELQMHLAPFVVGLGPGLLAGEHVHAVVETQRGPDLGRVIWQGAALADDGMPAAVRGYTHARVLRSPRDGVFRSARAIGELVAEGEAVGDVDGDPVLASVGGLLRGLLAPGVAVASGIKLGDVDPRGRSVDPARISDKARAVAAGVLEAVFRHLGGTRPLLGEEKR